MPRFGNDEALAMHFLDHGVAIVAASPLAASIAALPVSAFPLPPTMQADAGLRPDCRPSDHGE
jgi:hypothetical protein